MKQDCNMLNPLQRDGLSQEKRMVRALHPSYVAIDGKDISDLLLYAKSYAQLIQYYSLENNPSGDWRKFIESDITTLVATIEKFDVKALKERFEKATNEKNYLNQFKIIVETIQVAYDWFQAAVPELKLYTALNRVINSILENNLITSVSYAKRIEEIDNNVLQVAGLGLGFSALNIAAIQSDTSLFANNDLTNEDDRVLAHRKIKKAFDLAYESVLSIVFQAPDFLEETLEEYHQHNPHMALFLAFLKLFKIAQDHLNTITNRHLDYYYKEVLQLDLRPEHPDEVHLVFELAKNFQAELVEKGTLLKAGKDDFGTNVFFGLDNDIVVNKTQLYEDGLKTIFLDKIYDEDVLPRNYANGTTYQINNLHAASKANTKDGIEEELDEDEKWKTFGDATMPDAEIGFAISSPLFLLREGDRTINVTLFAEIEEGANIEFQNGNQITSSIARELMHNILVQYSAEDKWVPCRTSIVRIRKTNETSIELGFKLHILPEDPAFVAFNKEVLSPVLDTTFPVLYFLINRKGLSSQFSCAGTEPLVNENELDKIPDFIQVQILEFLNSPVNESAWAEIAAVEPQDGPVFDNPFVGSAPGNEATGYDIGETTARKMIRIRNTVHGGEFKNLQQVVQVQGVGVDKMNDLFYTFCSDFWKLIPAANPYRYLQALLVKKVDLSVSVSGMQNLVLENDVGVINPAKPFLPFGPIPKVGSKFYIGSQEVFSKKLSALTIDLEWADLPLENFKEHYSDYGGTDSPVTNNEYFNADLEILYKGEWLRYPDTSYPVIASNVQLFKPNGTNDSPISAREKSFGFSADYEAGQIATFDSFTNDLKRGFVRLSLKQDFQHKKYPVWLADSFKSGSHTGTPNEPYTPTISTFKVNYSASETIDFSQRLYPDSTEQFFHIAPFGWQKFYANEQSLPTKEAVFSQRFVPEFKVNEVIDGDQKVATDAEGTLYIGLVKLEPEQNVSILFQMAEGSSDPELPNQEVVWSYLRDNHWVDFDRTQLLSDTTNSLLTSGIVTLTMPNDMTDANTILTAGVYWIKVSTARLTKAINLTIAVMPQAVKASFRKIALNDLSRLKGPLVAETISKLKERKAVIKSVSQPYSSYNGKLIEQDSTPEGVAGEDRFKKEYNEFYVRVSERLRHKNRVVTIDDYERIVLQQFPDVYKVKCINHTKALSIGANGLDSPASEHAPGFVKLVVVPSLKNRNAVNPLQPRVSSNRLDEILNHLQPLKSGFVSLEVMNPTFEEVAVDFKVRFLPGYDKGFYEKKLKEDIVRFLSPWLYDEGSDLAIGGRLHRSQVLNFVEETEYVDYVTDFKLNHFIPGQDPRMDVEEAIAATSSSAIVSVPATEHLVDPNTMEEC